MFARKNDGSGSCWWLISRVVEFRKHRNCCDTCPARCIRYFIKTHRTIRRNCGRTSLYFSEKYLVRVALQLRLHAATSPASLPARRQVNTAYEVWKSTTCCMTKSTHPNFQNWDCSPDTIAIQLWINRLMTLCSCTSMGLLKKGRKFALALGQQTDNYWTMGVTI